MHRWVGPNDLQLWPEHGRRKQEQERNNHLQKSSKPLSKCFNSSLLQWSGERKIDLQWQNMSLKAILIFNSGSKNAMNKTVDILSGLFSVRVTVIKMAVLTCPMHQVLAPPFLRLELKVHFFALGGSIVFCDWVSGVVGKRLTTQIQSRIDRGATTLYRVNYIENSVHVNLFQASLP